MLGAMTQEEACDYLRENYQIDYAPSTLKSKRTTGDGPKYFRVKRTPLYTPETLDDYAKKQTTQAFASTAEERAAI